MTAMQSITLPLPARLSLVLAVAVSLTSAQERAGAGLPRFEVVSIKPGDSDTNVPRMSGAQVFPGGRILLRQFNLYTLVQTAFNVPFLQISIPEEWKKDAYIVEGKPPAEIVPRIMDFRYTNFTIEDETLRQMLQALLIDRFQLQFHRETRTAPVYLLERNDKPLALKVSETLPPGSRRKGADSSFGSIGYAGGQWSIWATSMPQLARFASGIMRAPVIDRTGLTEVYGYRQRQPDLEPRYDADQSDFFKSYLSEAGLKLERSTGPVEYLVIDHAEKPTPN